MNNLALLTDLYELTMAASYLDHGMFKSASFSLFIRNYPPFRSYFVCAGLDEVLHFLEDLRFSSDDLDYLKESGLFKPDFLSYLSEFRFTGQVHAIPEGRLFFVNEPIIEVTAPLIEAQIVETFLINAVGLQTMIATKASRCVHAAGPRKLVDFSLRRTQGIDAGMKVARASYIGGFIGTSNVLAAKAFGLPTFGTMAHSYITSFASEIEAFHAFARSFPENVILLIDTYDTLSGAEKAVEVARKMAKEGIKLKGVRLDSGDMAQLSKKVRKILKKAGLGKTMIFASGGFDEFKIKKVLEEGGDIDSFGVGTKMGVSADAPYLDMAYKLVKYDRQPVLKLSPGKQTLAAEKQVFRFKTPRGKLKRDVIALRGERLEGGEPLLKRVMRQGKIVRRSPSLSRIQKIFQDEFSRLDNRFKSIEGITHEYPVALSPELKSLQSQMIKKYKQQELGES
jgi:nicotinate phosphoribosyltransferase